MAEHLSSLVIDELAAQLPVADEARAHLAGCAECTARLESRKAGAAAFSLRLDAAKAKRELLARVAPPRRSLQRLAPAVGLALAASVALVVWWSPPGGNTSSLKGTAVLELADASGRTVSEAAPGDRLELRVGGGGLGHGAVLTRDSDKQVQCLWEGPVPPGITAVQPVTVTPGDVTLFLLLSAEPVDCATQVLALKAQPHAGELAPAAPREGRVVSTTLRVKQ